VQVERAHVALVPGDVQARLRRDLLRQHGEHLRARVDAHHGHAGARDRHRDATGPDGQLEDGAAEALGEVAVEGEVVAQRPVLEVIGAGEGGVARHLHAFAPGRGVTQRSKPKADHRAVLGDPRSVPIVSGAGRLVVVKHPPAAEQRESLAQAVADVRSDLPGEARRVADAEAADVAGQAQRPALGEIVAERQAHDRVPSLRHGRGPCLLAREPVQLRRHLRAEVASAERDVESRRAGPAALALRGGREAEQLRSDADVEDLLVDGDLQVLDEATLRVDLERGPGPVEGEEPALPADPREALERGLGALGEVLHGDREVRALAVREGGSPHAGQPAVDAEAHVEPLRHRRGRRGRSVGRRSRARVGARDRGPLREGHGAGSSGGPVSGSARAGDEPGEDRQQVDHSHRSLSPREHLGRTR
jgi:hypothetical protein